MKLNIEKIEQTLLLAGKLAVAARYAIGTKNLICSILLLQEALNNYDDEIIQFWRKNYKERYGITEEVSDAEILEQLAIEEYKEQSE